MPIKSCTLPNGKNGFKYGDRGHCYPDKKSAIKQGIMIHISQNKGDKKKAYKDFRKEMTKAEEEILQSILSDPNSNENEVSWASDVLDLSMHQRLTLSTNRRILKNS